MNEQPRVLYVDDDVDYSQAMATRCQNLGVAVRTAKNALTAMSIAENWRPDVVCFDVEMPTANGLDVCQFLGTATDVADATFIAITGRTDRDTIRRCQDLRAHYIAKSPSTWRQLRDVLCNVFPDIDAPAEPASCEA